MSSIWETDDRTSPYSIMGNWDADTNTPDITGTTTDGNAWAVSVAGATALGGITPWALNDIAVKTVGGWAKIAPASATWGTLAGTLSDQTDLNNALILKASAANVTTLSKNVTNELSSGIKSGFVISINADPTKIDISAGTGIIVDNSVVGTPVLTPITYAGVSAVTITNIALSNSTYIAINAAREVVQQDSPFTCEQRRTLIALGLAIHSNRTTVNVINNQPDVAISGIAQFNDLATGIDNFNVSGNVISSVVDTLTIAKSAGYIFKKGANFINNDLAPHIVTLGALLSPATIRYRLRNGTEYANTSTIDPSNYDLNGVLTPTGPNKFTIQRLTLFPSNLIRIQYGQAIYGSKVEAIQAISTEAFVEEENIATNGLLRAILVVKTGITNLNDTKTYQFFEADRFGSTKFSASGTSVTTLQQAYENSVRPQVVTSDELGAVEIKNGSSLGTNTVFSVQATDNDVLVQIKGTGESSFGNITDGNYSTFEADGTLKYTGTATVFRDINLSGATLLLGGAAAPGLIDFVDPNLKCYGFNGANTIERLYGSCELQHDYKEGSDLEFHIHWTPTTTNAGNVVWQVYYSWTNATETYSAGTLLTGPAVAATGAWKNTYTSLGIIPGAGKTMNSQLNIQIFRDPTNGADTYPDDAALIQFGIHYECDTTGSRVRTSK